jgi:cystathionine gamma-synthase
VAKRSLETRAVRAGVGVNREHGSVIPPIHLSSTFSFKGLGEQRQYDYTRSGNPTRDILGQALADLEGGHDAVVTSSGMAAVSTVLQLLGPDDLIVAPHDCYGGTHRLLTNWARKGQFRLRLVNQTDASALDEAFAEAPRMVWVETPSNPLLRVVDIADIVQRAAETDALVVVDNTFLSPALQRPIELGADLVVHSTTKYLNGHSDVVGGAVIARTEELAEEVAWWANAIGVTGSPFDSFLTMRGVRTLHARMQLHEANALAVVETLGRHPSVKQVHHPSLEDHPGHEIAASQQSGFGGMVSFELEGGRAQVSAFLEGLELFTLAESLGGVESLVCHPTTMTHAAMDEEARAVAGIGESLLRLSVGIEAGEDLVAELTAGLDRVAATLQPPLAASTAAATSALRAFGRRFGGSLRTENHQDRVLEAGPC